MIKQNSALVLSGGGALGLAHLGALQALEAEYEFNYIAGVSAGAIVGAGVAIGRRADEIIKILEDTNLFGLAFDFSLKNTGLLPGENIHQLLLEILGETKFEDLRVPLVIGCTDFTTGQRVNVRTGRVADAVRASLSIPLIFQPFYHPELKRYLADGFLSQNFPLDLALKEYQGDHIIGIDVATIPPLLADWDQAKWWGRGQDLFAVLQRTFRIMYQNQQTHFPADARVRLIEPDLSEFSSITLGRSKYIKMIEAGKTAAEHTI